MSKQIDRREALKRGAIIGGLAWSAPVIQSLGSPAFAQGASPLCQSGCYAVKIDRASDCPGATGVCEDLAPLPEGGRRFCATCNDNAMIGGTPQSGGGCACLGGSTTFEDCDCEENGAAGRATVVLPANCRFVSGCSKCASNECNCSPIVNGNTITFNPCGNHCVSHVEFCYCCD